MGPEAPDESYVVAPLPPVPKDIGRASLAPSMAVEDLKEVTSVTRALLERRFTKVREMVDVASTDVNLNPFLMLAMAPAYNIYSPFEAAEYAQYAKLPHGDSTAFGRFVEEKIFPIFGARAAVEKPRGQLAISQRRSDATLFSAIDGEITVEGTRYLITYKSGPWTMNQAHANEMIRQFPGVHERTGCDIIIAITYGRRDRLNNKPALVRRETGSYVHTLVGKDLWEFITGVENGHLAFYAGIREAQKQFALAHGGKTFYEHLIEARLKLAESFRTAFGLIGAEEDMWEMIFKGSF